MSTVRGTFTARCDPRTSSGPPCANAVRSERGPACGDVDVPPRGALLTTQSLDGSNAREALKRASPGAFKVAKRIRAAAAPPGLPAPLPSLGVSGRDARP